MQGIALAAWAREALTGHIQRLTWDVHLERDVGTPDGVGDPDGYNDRRWTSALIRLQGAIRSMQGRTDAVTELVVIVACPTHPEPNRIELPIAQLVDVELAQKPPPYGRWKLCAEYEVRQRTRNGEGLPSNFFLDGVPF